MHVAPPSARVGRAPESRALWKEDCYSVPQLLLSGGILEVWMRSAEEGLVEARGGAERTDFVKGKAGK